MRGKNYGTGDSGYSITCGRKVIYNSKDVWWPKIHKENVPFCLTVSSSSTCKISVTIAKCYFCWILCKKSPLYFENPKKCGDKLASFTLNKVLIQPTTSRRLNLYWNLHCSAYSTLRIDGASVLAALEYILLRKS